MWLRVIILVLIISPILVYFFIGGMLRYREVERLKRENAELRGISDKTEDDPVWGTPPYQYDEDERKWK